jgi:hypothetical protein
VRRPRHRLTRTSLGTAGVNAGMTMSALDVRAACVRRWEEHPARIAFRIGAIRGDGDVWVAETSISHEGGPWRDVVHVLTFEDGRLVRETVCPAASSPST